MTPGTETERGPPGNSECFPIVLHIDESLELALLCIVCSYLDWIFILICQFKKALDVLYNTVDSNMH